jgi:hypothetical protein
VYNKHFAPGSDEPTWDVSGSSAVVVETTPRKRFRMPNYRKTAQSITFAFVCAALCMRALPAAAQQSQPQPAQQVPSPEASHQSDPQQTAGENDEGRKSTRMFGVMPNNMTIEGAKKITPISSREKFKLVAESAFDPYEFGVVGILAGIGQATNDTPQWGQGARGYGIRYGTDFGDQVIGNFMVGAILPTVFRQDPRYFQSGKGSFWHRAGYALSRIVVTRGDSGAKQFNVSEIAGNGIAAVVSNSYHPTTERTLPETGQTWATQIGVDAIGYELKEFWPDIRRKLFRKRDS